MKKIIVIVFAILGLTQILLSAEGKTLQLKGRITIDGQGLENINIAGVKTDSSGYFETSIPSGIDTSFAPKYFGFLFEPTEYYISSTDTLLDSLNFLASRQEKKVIIISGQSNAEHCGDLKYFIEDTVDNHIPYYLAYSNGEFGLSTLGLLTKFGKSKTYCDGYNKGFGLEMLLARTLYKNYSDSLAVMKIPFSGTSLYQDWKPSGATWLWFVEKHENAETLYRARGYEPKYVAFYWFQGESDETPQASAAYATNLQTFVDRIRAHFSNDSQLDNLPFICVRIKWNPSSAYEAPVRAAQMDLPNHRDDCACVDVDDCDPYRYSSHNTHFNGGALNRIGFKMAAQFMEMIGTPIDSTVNILVDMDEMLDTTIVLHCEGDTTFDHVMTDLEFEFPAKIGEQFTFTLNLGSEIYNYSPATRSTSFAYPKVALVDPSFTFNVNKVVAITEYPEDINYVMLNAYPNPFNPQTALNFYLPSSNEVELKIYDIMGREVETLIDMHMESGSYKINWDASDLSSGVYFARMSAGHEVVTQKMMLLK